MKSTEEFRKELYAKYGMRLIVPDDAVYLGSKKDIKVICPKHGEKWMRPNNLLSGSACKECGQEIVKHKNSYTPNEFVEKAINKHQGKYEYPFIEEEYGKKEKIHILCKKCGKMFEQKPAMHLYGNGCPHCHPFPKSYTIEGLKEKISNKHPDIELISEYIGDNDSNITVKCKIHGDIWKTTPHRLLQQKYGCQKCYQEQRKKEIKKNQSEKFQNFLEKYYAPLYDISQVEYINSKTDVKLICPTHGEFFLKPKKMINRLDGCPYCNESHLEKNVKIILEKLNHTFEREKTFDWLINKSNMFLDFYLPQYNIAIECQGEQHIIERKESLMNKNDNFENKVSRDQLKYKLCQEHGIPIIYILNKKFAQQSLNEQFNHIYDNALFIEDIEENPQILLEKINEAKN